MLWSILVVYKHTHTQNKVWIVCASTLIITLIICVMWEGAGRKGWMGCRETDHFSVHPVPSVPTYTGSHKLLPELCRWYEVHQVNLMLL